MDSFSYFFTDSNLPAMQMARSLAYFKTLRQKSHSSLAGGMNATNLWYNAPIHSYLRQEVSEVTPLEI
ncbi:hypothetical protein [Helicobacter suis]|uniref:hypothetical protein n=1 Tax=Helicobacter suis TaxID=104628 RepID=UPI001596D541|nr:hypothetical protein [Helicobacter suis]